MSTRENLSHVMTMHVKDEKEGLRGRPTRTPRRKRRRGKGHGSSDPSKPYDNWSSRLKRKVKGWLAERDGLWCMIGDCCMPFCSVEEATIDHVKPRSRGGSDDVSNLRLACAKCNEDKADRLDGEPRKLKLFYAKAIRKAEFAIYIEARSKADAMRLLKEWEGRGGDSHQAFDIEEDGEIRLRAKAVSDRLTLADIGEKKRGDEKG